MTSPGAMGWTEAAKRVPGLEELTQKLRNLITETDHTKLHTQIDAGISVEAADLIEVQTAALEAQHAEITRLNGLCHTLTEALTSAVELLRVLKERHQ